MARRSSVGRSARSAPRPKSSPPPKSASNAPPPASQAPTAAPAQGGFGGLIAEGLAWGTGNAIAHRAVDSVVGPRTVQVEHVGPQATAAPAHAAASMAGSDACSLHNKAFQECLNGNGSDISQCQYYMDMLAACRRNSGSMMSS